MLIYELIAYNCCLAPLLIHDVWFQEHISLDLYNEVISSIIEEIKGKKKDEDEEGACFFFLEQENHLNDKRERSQRVREILCLRVSSFPAALLILVN